MIYCAQLYIPRASEFPTSHSPNHIATEQGTAFAPKPTRTLKRMWKADNATRFALKRVDFFIRELI